MAHYEKYSQRNSALVTYAVTVNMNEEWVDLQEKLQIIPAVIIGTSVCILQTSVVPVNAMFLICSLISAIV